MKVCSKCGRTLNEESNFCPSCGIPVITAEEKNYRPSPNKKGIIAAIAIAVVVITLLCVAVPLSMTYAKTMKIKKNTELGNKYIMQGNYEEAVLSFSKVINIDKQNIPARMGIIKAYIESKNYDEALSFANEALEIDYENTATQKKMFDLYFIIAQKSIENKQYDSAENAVNKALRIDNKNISFYNGIADSYINQEEIISAVNLLKTATSLTNDEQLKTKLKVLYKNSTGNSPGNIENGGYVVSDDNYLYIGFDNGIYKIDRNNKYSKTKMPNTQGYTQYLNIDKNYLYFSSTTYSGSNNDVGKDLICKIKLDGSESKILFEGNDAFGDYGSYLTLKNGRLFFINKSGNIVSIDTEGKNLTTVCKDNCESISISDEYIYYINNDDTVKYSYKNMHGDPSQQENGKIYRIGFDGSGREKISDDGASSIAIYDEYLYYTNLNDGEVMDSEGDSWYSGKLYRTNLDGKNKKKITNDAVSSFNIDEDWIYTCDIYTIIRINKNTSEKQHITDLSYGGSLNIVDSELFFHSSTDVINYDHLYYNDNDYFGFYSIRLDQPFSRGTAPSNSSSGDGFIIPYSGVIKLTIADIINLSKEQLGIARNEIYARHGYIFQTDKYNLYFKSQSWYIPNAAFKESMLSEVEKYNIEFIRKYE